MCIETTASGCRLSCRSGCGLLEGQNDIIQIFGVDRTFSPKMDAEEADKLYGWLADCG